MNSNKEHLESIKQIHSIMERSTTFMSLTGLSGIMAGLFGLLTALLVALKLDALILDGKVIYRIVTENDLQVYLVALFVCSLIVTLLTAFGLTVRKAGKRGVTVWDNVSQRFAMHIFLPLFAGGLFIVALMYHGQFQLICPAMLLFFGLALLSAARFVQMDMFLFGTVQICLGIIGAFWYEAGLILWAVGFGVTTLLYGTIMYYKYEK